jgi:hypothetical protein
MKPLRFLALQHFCCSGLIWAIHPFGPATPFDETGPTVPTKPLPRLPHSLESRGRTFYRGTRPRTRNQCRVCVIGSISDSSGAGSFASIAKRTAARIASSEKGFCTIPIAVDAGSPICLGLAVT